MLFLLQKIIFRKINVLWQRQVTQGLIGGLSKKASNRRYVARCSNQPSILALYVLCSGREVGSMRGEKTLTSFRRENYAGKNSSFSPYCQAEEQEWNMPRLAFLGLLYFGTNLSIDTRQHYPDSLLECVVRMGRSSAAGPAR